MATLNRVNVEIFETREQMNLMQENVEHSRGILLDSGHALTLDSIRRFQWIGDVEEDIAACRDRLEMLKKERLVPMATVVYENR